jgi:hypothetical protein
MKKDTYHVITLVSDAKSYREMQYEMVRKDISPITLYTETGELPDFYFATHTEIFAKLKEPVDLYTLKYTNPGMEELKNIENLKNEGKEYDKRKEFELMMNSGVEKSDNDFLIYSLLEDQGRNLDFATTSSNHINLEGQHLSYLYGAIAAKGKNINLFLQERLIIPDIASLTCFYSPNYQECQKLKIFEYDATLVKMIQKK